jgi:hypothetical protein
MYYNAIMSLTLARDHKSRQSSEQGRLSLQGAYYGVLPAPPSEIHVICQFADQTVRFGGPRNA